MTDDPSLRDKRNYSLLIGQMTLNSAAWMMASPSIVLTFLAVALGMPVFLAGALVPIRQTANSLADIFLFGTVSRIKNRKLALSLTEFAIALCFAMTLVAVLFGSKSQAMLIFVLSVFALGVIDEIQQLLLADFISDNLESRARRTSRYAQMAMGGVIAVALTWIAHEATLALPAAQRHSIIVAIGIICLALSALTLLAMRDKVSSASPKAKAQGSSARTLSSYLSNVLELLNADWFRYFIAIRVMFASVVLAVPFFSLVYAAKHHTSNAGLTALIMSYAMGYIVAGPLWGVLNRISNRLVMVTSALMVALSGMILIYLHFLRMEGDVRIYAAALFAVTVAVRGVGAVTNLYFMDIAPKDQRIQGIAIARSLLRFATICIATGLAAVAHFNETIWAIVFITIASLAAAMVSFLLAHDMQDKHKGLEDRSHHVNNG